jgi:hypothetical protein
MNLRQWFDLMFSPRANQEAPYELTDEILDRAVRNCFVESADVDD